MPDVQGRCPACGAASLSLGEGGHVTCSRIDCPAPGEADDLLHGRESVYALSQALGGPSIHLIALALSAHGRSLADVRRMSDEEFRAVPGIGDTSLAAIRRAFPAPPARKPQQPPVVGTACIQLDVTGPTAADLPDFERAQAVARAEEAEATIRRVRDASAYIRATTRTWDPVADIIDAALDEDGDPVHARVAAAVRTVLNQDLPGDMGGHVATAVLAVLRKEAPRES